MPAVGAALVGGLYVNHFSIAPVETLSDHLEWLRGSLYNMVKAKVGLSSL